MTHKSISTDQFVVYQRRFILLSIILLAGLGGCSSTQSYMTGTESACIDNQNSETQELPSEAFKNTDDLLTVDCLLPGIPIQIGMNQQWMSPPRPAVITAWQCKVQGGQYAKTSDKDGRTMALSVWQLCANQGDKVAQNYMGEIYAKSWGRIVPDYTQAANWFRKSAEQGYTRAQNNLGFLYESGLGVPKNKQSALQLYRKAMGAVKPITLDATSKGEINALESKLGQAMQTTKTLQKQLKDSEVIATNQQLELNSLINMQGTASEIHVQLRKAQNDLAETRKREDRLKRQLTNLQPELETLRGRLNNTETQVALKDLPKMGTYYALIIGINEYQFPLANLKTPVNDAKRIEKILREKYGFITTLLTNDKANKRDIYKALIKLRKNIKNTDNLLIYFAGHGDLSSGSAYWLAQNAESENDANWISTDDITRKINFTDESIKARHVLIVSDSCYSAGIAASWIGTSSKQVIAALPNGVITRSAHSAQIIVDGITSKLTPQPEGLSAEERIGWIKAKYILPSRKILTSGGIEPVIDQEIKNGLSIFANAFSNALEANTGIIAAEQIYKRIGPQIVSQVSKRGMTQTPVYTSLRRAGDNFGEFYFVSH